MQIALDATSSVPPFEQLRSQVATQVASGDLPAGSKLPTVRQLAADLGLAANTVARAYRELEADGIIVTHGRRGTFVSSAVLAERGPMHDLARDYADAARRSGLTCSEAQRLVEQAWSR